MKRVVLIATSIIIAVFIYRVVSASEPNILSTLGQRVNSKSGLALTDEPTGNTSFQDESTIVAVIEKSLPSVVTVKIKTTSVSQDRITLDPFNPFGAFRRIPGEAQTIEQNIGSGFIVSEDGLIITNKHVVADAEATYQVIMNDEKTHSVTQIYRDPLNDLAILKINVSTTGRALPLGNSSALKLGQVAIAIGTPLGEFTNTVTTGIVSGLGRGITAGSPYEGFVERLDNVIQTDAAISAGNSGGPLLNSQGQVIGVNTAVSASGQNIGFAIPSNTLSELIASFNKRGGSFEKPYIGVRYKVISREVALQNNAIEGAYIAEAVPDSPAAKAGLVTGDIIVTFDGKKIEGRDEQALAKLILDHKPGDTVELGYWRDGKTTTTKLTLEKSSE